MNFFKVFLFFAITLTLNLEAQEKTQEFYQLKIYSLNSNEQVVATDAYLKDVYIPTLKKMKLKNIGVFKLKSNAVDSIKKIFVLIPFTNFIQFANMDSDFKKIRNDLLKSDEGISLAYNKQSYTRVESILLKAFKDMPQMQASKVKGPRSERIYELRSYESANDMSFESKVDMFNDGGEIKLFDKLNFNAVFYSEVIAGAKMPNLMYMTTFSNKESRDKHWKAFVDAPEWKKMSSLPKYQKNVSHIDVTFLYPTEYSDY